MTKRKTTVLVVDDDPSILGAVTRLLAMEGYDALVAGSGEEALRIFTLERPDLVLLDLRMPGIDGHETCRRIRKKSQIPVIMVTSHASLDEMRKGYEAGADGFVMKPFLPQELLGPMNAVLNRTKATPTPVAGSVS
jgi:DNA-binding response OmpR family regulator